MEKKFFRNLSWILSTIFVFTLLIFCSQTDQSLLPRESEISWSAILWLTGALFSVISGIITMITEEVKGFQKFFNAFSAIFFASFLIVWLIPGKDAKDISLIDLILIDWLFRFLVLGSAISRIVAEFMSAKEFIKKFHHTSTRCSFEEQP